MKVIMITVIALCIAMGAIAQENTSSTTKPYYGYHLGVNYSMATVDGINSADMQNGVGFGLGIFMEYALVDFLIASPKAEIQFYAAEVEYLHASNDIEKSSIMPATVEIKPHFKLKHPTSEELPYLFAGPNIIIPISDNDNSLVDTKTTFAFDLGLGFENRFQYFNFAPEVRYSYGLQNIATSNTLSRNGEIHLHSVALLFNFY